MVKIYYNSLSIDNQRKIVLIKFELKTDENLRIAWNTLYRYETKDLIEITTRKMCFNIVQNQRPHG